MGTSDSPVTIRAAEQRDAETFRDLRLEALCAHPEAFGSDCEQQTAYPLSHWQDRLRASSNNPLSIIQFAVVDDALIGMAGMYRNEGPKQSHGGNIWGVYVRPEWRGQHIAERLIEACISYGRTQGVRLVKLGVVTTNVAAIRCYLRCGFSIYGVDPAVIFYAGVYYDEFLMMRRLNTQP